MLPYPHLITNFSKEELHIYTLCVTTLNEKANDIILTININATMQDGTKLPNDRALFIHKQRDLSDFWSLFYYIRGCVKTFKSI